MAYCVCYYIWLIVKCFFFRVWFLLTAEFGDWSGIFASAGGPTSMSHPGFTVHLFLVSLSEFLQMHVVYCLGFS